MSKTLIITGGSRGIGLATIKHFIKQDWRIINISRTAAEIEKVINISMDLSSPAEIKSHADNFKELLEGASKVVVVHSAVFYERDSIDTLAFADMQKTFMLNVIAPTVLNQVLIPYMPAGSSIMFIGSTLSRKAVPSSASYTVSKHALMGLMKATCQDLREHNIRSNAVCPGLVDTQLLKDTMDEATQKYLLENQIIGGRLIAPEEIAEVIYFTSVTSCLNGVIINADLGQVAD